MRYRAEVLRELAGGRRLEQIDELADLVRRRGAEAALKPASINRYLAILKRVATLAYRWRWTDRPLAPHIELLPGEARRTVYATPPDLRRLIAAADARIRDLVLAAALTGLRKSELLRLKPAHIDGSAIVLGADTKTGQPRVVPLPPALRSLRHKLPWQISAANLRKLFEQARVAAGLPHLRWHDLRRTYGTWLLRAGASLADVRDLLGHADA